MLALAFLGPEAIKQKPLTAEAVMAHFEYIKATAFKGRYYTVETLAHYVRAKVLGIDLNVLGLYPEGFVEQDIVVSPRQAEYIALQKQAPKIEKDKKVKGL